MLKLFLFGSRASNDHRKDSDFDVFVINGTEKLYAALSAYAVEIGGNLDLFSFAGTGDCLLPVYGNPDERRVYLDKHGFAGVKEISLEDLLGHPDLKMGNEKWPMCQECGQRKYNVSRCVDPYTEDVFDEEVEMDMCPECYDAAGEEI